MRRAARRCSERWTRWWRPPPPAGERRAGGAARALDGVRHRRPLRRGAPPEVDGDRRRVAVLAGGDGHQPAQPAGRRRRLEPAMLQDEARRIVAMRRGRPAGERGHLRRSRRRHRPARWRWLRGSSISACSTAAAEPGARRATGWTPRSADRRDGLLDARGPLARPAVRRAAWRWPGRLSRLLPARRAGAARRRPALAALLPVALLRRPC